MDGKKSRAQAGINNLRDFAQNTQGGSPLVNYGIYASARTRVQTAEELDHELAIKRAQKDCDVLARVRMISDEDKRNYHSMMISSDKESNLLAIASIDQKILELSQLVEMYNAGFNKKEK